VSAFSSCGLTRSFTSTTRSAGRKRSESGASRRAILQKFVR
jgi:hypothetical protein